MFIKAVQTCHKIETILKFGNNPHLLSLLHMFSRPENLSGAKLNKDMIKCNARFIVKPPGECCLRSYCGNNASFKALKWFSE